MDQKKARGGHKKSTGPSVESNPGLEESEPPRKQKKAKERPASKQASS